MFFFKRQRAKEAYKNLIYTIKRDLRKTLETKGVDISQINVDIQSDNLNVQVYVRQKSPQTF